MLTKDYFSLSETLEQSEIETLVIELLELQEKDKGIKNIDVAEALIQLIIRQAYHCKIFSDEILQEIQNWTEQAWAEQDPELVDALCTIIVSLPTQKGKEMLQAGGLSKNNEIKRLSKEALEEFKVK